MNTSFFPRVNTTHFFLPSKISPTMFSLPQISRLRQHPARGLAGMFVCVSQVKLFALIKPYSVSFCVSFGKCKKTWKLTNCLKSTKNRTVANKSAKEDNPTHVLNHFVRVESWRRDKCYRTRTNTRGEEWAKILKANPSNWVLQIHEHKRMCHKNRIFRHFYSLRFILFLSNN